MWDFLGNIGDFIGGLFSIVSAFSIIIAYKQLKHQLEESRKANMPEVEIEVEEITKDNEISIRVIIINSKNVPAFLLHIVLWLWGKLPTLKVKL